MRKSVVSIAVIVVSVVWCSPALPWAVGHMSGVPVAQQPGWPAGLAELLNGEGRVYGYWLNGSDFFYYQGDTEAFNAFVAKYARLKGSPLKLVLHGGRGKADRLGAGGTIPYDWEVKVLWRRPQPSAPREANREKSGYDVLVELWLGGEIKLNELDIPSEVKVESGGEITSFVAAHQSGQERAEKDAPSPAPNAQTGNSGAPASPAKANPISFNSKRPLYGKLALTKDGSRVLSVVLDESGGTRTGHDVLYADTNFNGRFEESERHAADKTKRYGKWLSSSSFAPIKLNVPFNENAKGIPNPCQVTLGYRLYPKPGVPEDFSVEAKVRLREGDGLWEYTIKGNLLPARTLTKAAVSGLDCAPTLQITTRADERKKGNLGIGLELVAGEHEIECSKEGKPVEAHVEIRTPDGTLVHKGDATLDKFTFG